MKYYLWINETQDGPFAHADILKMLNEGLISKNTLACEEGATELKWIKVCEIPFHFSLEVEPKPQPSDSSYGVPETPVAYYSSYFGRIYLIIGVILSFITAFTVNFYIGTAFLLSTVAAGIFFMALGEIIRILNDIRSELKNRRSP